ncbi:GHKL domain-containing protein [Candidatus Poribacteria bacterium]|nr:GHKL domain-containing protein [Candidatus Poribacteria bacterium]
MYLKSRLQEFRNIGFFRSYFILGILCLSIAFLIYSNWVTSRLERETAEFSKMLANFTAQLSSIADKETSDAARAIIDSLEFPFIVTDANGQPVIARGIGGGLREKMQAGTLTSEDRKKINKIIEKMDKNHKPITMKGVLTEEGRAILGYFYFNQIKWSLDESSSLVVTDIDDRPFLWQNIQEVEANPFQQKGTEIADKDRVALREFVLKSKRLNYVNTLQFNPTPETAYFHYGRSGLIHQIRWWIPLAQMILVATFNVIGIISYQKMKHNEQQAVWAGLAKETAHQLGTPISSLMGWLEILQDQEGSKENKDVYKDMQNDVKRLKSITDRFGEIGSMPKRVLLDVSEVIHNAVVYFQKRLPNRQKHVEIIEDHQIVPKVEANENLMQWVIENLIRNSLDAIERDNGKIHIRTQLDPKNKNVMIVYSDNGKGIPRKKRRKVFLPGYSSKKHGWGLGLAIVKRIIEGYHGGNISIVNSGPEGTTFIITLPAAIDNN